MKICYIADAANVHTQKWVDYFVRRGDDVEVITFLGHSLPGAKVYHFKPPWGFQLFEQRAFYRKLSYFALISGIRRLVRRLKPDILHAHRETSYGLMGAMTGYHPFILSTWGYETQWLAKSNKLYEWLLRFNLSKADIITATSLNLTADTKLFAPPTTPLFTIPFGVDCQRFRVIEDIRAVKHPPTIGIVKRLEEESRVHDLIDAFALLKPRLPEARLLIIGEGSYRPILEAQVKRLGLLEEVKFMGWLENNYLPDIINQFDVFSLPSFPESFGVAILEALACGVPVVAINEGGPAELLCNGVTGYLVPPSSPLDMAEAFYELLNDDKKRLEMGRKGRQFVLENYQWEATAAMMAKIYDQLLTRALP